MVRYFFRLQDGGTLMDDTGEWLAGDAAATEAAIDVFAETLQSKRDHLGAGGSYTVTVFTENDAEVYSITAQGRRP